MNQSPKTIPTMNPDKVAQAVQSTKGWGLFSKTMLGAIACCAVPLLLVSLIAYGWSTSLKTRSSQTVAVKEVQQHSTTLGLGAGALAILSGAIAALLAHRTVRSFLTSANLANTLVNRLQREDIPLRSRVGGQDELVALATNLQIIAAQFPQLLANQEVEAERAKIVMDTTQRLRQATAPTEVLRLAVEDIRKVLRTDRVALFRFDSAEDGTIIEESVDPGWPKMLWTSLTDPCLANYLTQYQNGRVRAIDDIYHAGLDHCHIGLLERFAVKANLIAPIIQDNQLFGLLIVHQCSGPRLWQQTEIDLLTQLATQIGWALERTRLVEQLEVKASQSHHFIEISRRIQSSLNPDDILKATVAEVRKVLATDRVLVFSFDAHWYGTVVAESVVPGYPKALWAKIKDPCFEQGYVEQYQRGRVQATHNIDEAGLTACHLQQLAPFGVKANLVAPILKDDHLFALLIAHECAKPRHWQQSEIDLFTQIATEVGLALDHARVLSQVDTRADHAQLLIDISQRLQTSFREADIFQTAVEQVRKAIRADRVVVSTFGADGQGKVVAESVLVGWPHALNNQYEEARLSTEPRTTYRAGCAIATPNVFAAGLSPDHLYSMERLKIQASLVAPLFKQEHLVGVLVAHQCSGPRDWQLMEIDLLTHVAEQVGVAIHYASLLGEVDQAYHSAESASEHQRQQLNTLQHQVSTWLQQNESTVSALANDMLQQMEGVTEVYQPLKLLAEAIQANLLSLSQQHTQHQQAHVYLTQEQFALEAIRHCLSNLQTNGAIAAERIQHLSHPAEQVASISKQITQLASQMKLQAMNAALEATRKGESAQEFANIGEKVLDLARQLDTQTTELASVARLLQSQLSIAASAIQDDTQQRQLGWQHLQQAEQASAAILDINTQSQTRIESMVESAKHQSDTSTVANQRILEVASHTHQAAERAQSISATLKQVAILSVTDEG